MEKAQLTVHNLTKRFTQGATFCEVLNSISYTFKQGETYAIAGVSGTGKSTLLHLLAGLDTPTSGTVTFNGFDLARQSANQQAYFLSHSMGLVFQLPYLIQELSVIENVALKGLIAGNSYVVARERAYALLESVELAHKVDALPATLSGGQQQRVAIVRALFNQPAFLLADEPTGNLDEKTARNVIDFLHDCQKQWGMGLIVSSHDRHIAQTMHYSLRLHDGQLIIQ